jgi:antagonist of KipI
MSMIDIEVIHSGLLTSIQDDGRRGVAFYGIPASGHLDPVAAHKANELVGNARSAPVVECNLLAPQLRFIHAATFSVTGADMRWTLGDKPLARNTGVHAPAGAVLHGAYTTDGARAYIAISGTIECQHDHQSASTYTYAALGGLEGHALGKGDVIHVIPPTEPLTAVPPTEPLTAADLTEPLTAVPPTEPLTAPAGSSNAVPGGSTHTYNGSTTIRFERGPEWNLLTAEAQRVFASAEYSISTDSNRMGARLNGPALATNSLVQMETVPLLPGTVQLPGSGKPIVILADGQTTGGYPRIAIIPESELARFNQIRPGLSLGFQE